MSVTSTNSAPRSAPLVFLVLFALVCGVVGVAYRVYQTPEVVEKPAPPLRQVPVASGDLRPGRRLLFSDMYMVSLSEDDFNKLVKGKKVFNTPAQLAGRFLKAPVNAGEGFALDSVYAEGTGPTPAEKLSEGMRASTVRVSLVGGIRGFAAPDTWVDVLFRRNSGSSSPSTESVRTHTLIPGVRILAIQDDTYSNSILSGSSRPQPVGDFELTLELTPEQAEVLKSVEQRGDLSLNLLPQDPNRKNLGTLPSPEVMRLVLGIEDPKPAPPVVNITPPPSVRIVRGGAQSSVTVDFQTDLIMDRALYPAPAGNAQPSAAPPSPPAVDTNAAPAWPVFRPPVQTAPQPEESESQAPAEADPAAPAASGTAVPASKSQRGSAAYESSVIVRRSEPRTRSGFSSLSPLRTAPPVRTIRQSSTRSRPRSLEQARSTSRGASQVSAVRATSTTYGKGQLPLLLSGPRQPSQRMPYASVAARTPVYAADPRRPLVLTSASPSTRSGFSAPASGHKTRSTTSSSQLSPAGSLLLSQSSRLPLLKSGPQY